MSKKPFVPMNAVAVRLKLIEVGRWLQSQSAGEIAYSYNQLQSVYAGTGTFTKLPQDRRERLGHLAGGSSVIYVFATIEGELDDDLKNLTRWLGTDDMQQFNAWRHVRHSAAHKSNGGRATGYRKQFDDKMSSPNQLHGIRSHSASELFLEPVAGLMCVIDLGPIVQRATAAT